MPGTAVPRIPKYTKEKSCCQPFSRPHSLGATHGSHSPGRRHRPQERKAPCDTLYRIQTDRRRYMLYFLLTFRPLVSYIQRSPDHLEEVPSILFSKRAERSSSCTWWSGLGCSLRFTPQFPTPERRQVASLSIRSGHVRDDSCRSALLVPGILPACGIYRLLKHGSYGDVLTEHTSQFMI